MVVLMLTSLSSFYSCGEYKTSGEELLSATSTFGIIKVFSFFPLSWVDTKSKTKNAQACKPPTHLRISTQDATDV